MPRHSDVYLLLPGLSCVATLSQEARTHLLLSLDPFRAVFSLAFLSFFFFFNDTATTEIYTLSLHDALPICSCAAPWRRRRASPTSSRFCRSWDRGARSKACEPAARCRRPSRAWLPRRPTPGPRRSEEHTSELQSLTNLVCRLLLEKKKQPQQRQALNHLVGSFLRAKLLVRRDVVEKNTLKYLT